MLCHHLAFIAEWLCCNNIWPMHMPMEATVILKQKMTISGFIVAGFERYPEHRSQLMEELISTVLPLRLSSKHAGHAFIVDSVGGIGIAMASALTMQLVQVWHARQEIKVHVSCSVNLSPLEEGMPMHNQFFHFCVSISVHRDGFESSSSCDTDAAVETFLACRRAWSCQQQIPTQPQQEIAMHRPSTGQKCCGPHVWTGTCCQFSLAYSHVCVLQW